MEAETAEAVVVYNPGNIDGFLGHWASQRLDFSVAELTKTAKPTFRTLKCHTQVLTLQAFEFKGFNTFQCN